MPRTNIFTQILEEAESMWELADFGGGLNSETNIRKLPENQSPNCENVKFGSDGRIIGRDGFTVVIGNLSTGFDGHAAFWGTDNVHHRVEWRNSNIYDVTGGAEVLIQAAAYTAGNRIAWADLNNLLYWSDGTTLKGGMGADADTGMRVYDPVGATDTWVAFAGGASNVPPPACKSLTAAYGSLVAGNCKTSNVAEPHGVRWCAPLDPTTWAGANIFQVGGGAGGNINSVAAMTVSAAGVTPYEAIFVGKDKAYTYTLKGALAPTTLQEILTGSTAGVKDGRTVRYVPGAEDSGGSSSGYITWLGTDSQVWYTNGVFTGVLSKDILRELQDQVQNSVLNAVGNYAAVNVISDHLYALDLGVGYWYCWDYHRKCWTRYRGWASGIPMESYDSNGVPVVFTADSTNKRYCHLNTGATDNGAPIDAYWRSGYLDMGDPTAWKVFKEIYVDFRTDICTIDYAAVTNQGNGPPATGIMVSGSAGDKVLIWDEGNWDENLWADSFSPYLLYKRSARLGCAIANLPDRKDKCQGYDVQLTVSQDPAGGHFEIQGIQVTFIRDGRRRTRAQ